VVNYLWRPARLRLVLNNRELWAEAWANPAPFAIPFNGSAAAAVAANKSGEPNYELFAKAPMPAYFPGPAAPQGSLGSSDFTPGGVRDSPPR
jgi:hypothetical protein